MKPSVYEISCVCDGEFFIMPKPSSEWLDDDIHAYQSMGIDKIVSLLEQDEVVELGLLEERACCVKHGIEFVQFPIPDRGVPDRTEFAKLVRQTHGDLVAGLNVGVHCRAGIGRSGVIAACVLQHFALTADDAVAIVSSARGIEVPDTDEQLQYIQAFARSG